MNQSLLCGYLTIHNLTPEFPVLTTFFEGEIIGPHHGFITGKWEADATIDKNHWQKFDYFRQHCQHFLVENSSPLETVSAPPIATTAGNSIEQRARLLPRPNDFNANNANGNGHGECSHITENGAFDFMEEPIVFMRWKEYFLVPDHHVETVNGASYAGFYYTAYDKTTQKLEGYYYHRESKDYQKLELDCDQKKTSASFDFR